MYTIVCTLNKTIIIPQYIPVIITSMSTKWKLQHKLNQDILNHLFLQLLEHLMKSTVFLMRRRRSKEVIVIMISTDIGIFNHKITASVVSVCTYHNSVLPVIDLINWTLSNIALLDKSDHSGTPQVWKQSYWANYELWCDTDHHMRVQVLYKGQEIMFKEWTHFN